VAVLIVDPVIQILCIGIELIASLHSSRTTCSSSNQFWVMLGNLA